MNTPIVTQISECFIKPKYEVEEANKLLYLAPMDLAMLSMHYIQKGLLFTKPSTIVHKFSIHKFLESLKESLSLTLVHFYPLSGQLVTQLDKDQQNKCYIFVDCNKGPGAKFIHATLDMSIHDIISPIDVPVVVKSFFDHDRDVNIDGHFKSLLTIKVTELLDGIFIGCSMNHGIVDGTSYWHFWSTWSKIHLAKHKNESYTISNIPIHERWFPNGLNPPILLPFTDISKFISRYETPQLRERIFHFSSESIATLKSKANNQTNNTTHNKTISSFQALSAHCWRAIVRSNYLNLTHDDVTKCKLTANNRHRLNPPLPQGYSGNCISVIIATTTVRELLENKLGWVASLVHESVVKHSDKVVRDNINEWIKSPSFYKLENLVGFYMGSSPRFDMYGNEFGVGKAIGVRSGYANKYAGKVTCYPGYEGGGSVDLEICLPPHQMQALEFDEEFMSVVRGG